jgi:hypothetical protein
MRTLFRIEQATSCIVIGIVISALLVGSPNGMSLAFPAKETDSSEKSKVASDNSLAADPNLFVKWAVEQRADLSLKRNKLRALGKTEDADKIKPLLLEDTLFTKLRKGDYIPDEAVLALSGSWLDYNNFKPAIAKQSLLSRYSETLRVVRSLAPYFKYRANLQAKLFKIEGDILYSAGDYQNAAVVFDKAHKVLGNEKLATDILNNQISINLAVSLEQIKENDKADALFFEVYGYPFYKIDDANLSQKFKEQHIAAIRGLIRTRRFNLNALKRLYLYGAVRDVVGPELDQAIIEAQNMPTSK